MDGKRNHDWNYYLKSNDYLCFDLSDRNDRKELEHLKNPDSKIIYIVTPCGERFACLRRS
jgi:hypothetical protein